MVCTASARACSREASADCLASRRSTGESWSQRHFKERRKCLGDSPSPVSKRFRSSFQEEPPWISSSSCRQNEEELVRSVIDSVICTQGEAYLELESLFVGLETTDLFSELGNLLDVSSILGWRAMNVSEKLSSENLQQRCVQVERARAPDDVYERSASLSARQVTADSPW